jgi:hypothetical protein
VGFNWFVFCLPLAKTNELNSDSQTPLKKAKKCVGIAALLPGFLNVLRGRANVLQCAMAKTARCPGPKKALAKKLMPYTEMLF